MNDSIRIPCVNCLIDFEKTLKPFLALELMSNKRMDMTRDFGNGK